MQTTRTIATALGLALLATPTLSAQAKDASQEKQNPGYTDTPMLPGGKWCVHDSRRPQPRVVTPGTNSTETAAGKAPSDAIVLFDGKDLSRWRGAKGEAKWKVEDGVITATRTGPIRTIDSFGDCQLHIEWSAPLPVKGNSQGRGNSGVFLMDRYEVQILDSYKNPTYPDGQAAALYGQSPPLVNASRPPGTWQSYDIIFTAPRFDGDKLVKPAYVTVIHNGVVVHHHKEILGPTRHKKTTTYKPHGPTGPIHLQDHGNPIRFRNIWVRPLKNYDTQ